MNHKQQKSSVEKIRQRFDNDVERFSNLDIGQSSTVDAPLALELVAGAAAAVTPHATHLLDIGCGAGNYTLKILPGLPHLEHITLNDLSRPMLERAQQRIGEVTGAELATFQGDIREMPLPPESVDIVLAAAVLHHLREESEWEVVFAKIFEAIRPGGGFWIVDLVTHSHEAVHALMWARYGEYLAEFRDEAYRDHVFAYIAEEDSPRPLMFQLDLLRQVGLRGVDVLHKNSCFAAFGGVK